jgi:Cu+-exporting ATPase
MSIFTFTVTGMHCTSCGILIDDTLEDDVPGITRSETNVRKGQTIVTAAEGVSAEAIAAAIASAGYQATLESTA